MGNWLKTLNTRNFGKCVNAALYRLPPTLTCIRNLRSGLPYDKIQQRVLYMQVMDWDRFSRNDPIGEICLPLQQLDLSEAQPQWEYLSPCRGSVSAF